MSMKEMITNASIAFGAFIVATGSVTYAAPSLSPSWSTQIVNNASASVSPPNGVDMQVFQTSWAKADANLGTLNGTLKISFDWTITAQGWYEIPAVGLATNGRSILQIPGCDGHTDVFKNKSCGKFIGLVEGPSVPGIGGLEATPYATTTGTFSKNVPVAGQTDVVFSVIPSAYSGNSDHLNTYFNITNLRFKYTPNPAR